jgi:hypothetical protein
LSKLTYAKGFVDGLSAGIEAIDSALPELLADFKTDREKEMAAEISGSIMRGLKKAIDAVESISRIEPTHDN